MPVVVPVYFDYASCLCYIAWRIGVQLEADLDVALRWQPVQIAAHYPGWEHGRLIGGDTRAKIARVAAETGVALRIPERWLDSRAALEGAVFAAEHDRLPEYHRAVFGAAFECGEDIADRHLLVRIAGEAGLPVGRFMESLATRRAAAQLAATLDAARRHGIVGYPTFLFGEFPLTGIQPYETMRLLFERHIRRCHEELH